MSLAFYFKKKLVLVNSEVNDNILEYRCLLSPSRDIRFLYLEVQYLEGQPILWVNSPEIIFTKAKYDLHKTTPLILRQLNEVHI